MDRIYRQFMQYAYSTKEKEYKISDKNILKLKQSKVL